MKLPEEFIKLRERIQQNPRIRNDPMICSKLREYVSEYVRHMSGVEMMFDNKIAEELGVSPSMIRTTREEYGIPGGYEVRQEYRRQTLIKTWNKTKSVEAVADAMGMSRARAATKINDFAKQGLIKKDGPISWNPRRTESKDGKNNGNEAREFLERLFGSRVGPVRNDLPEAYCIRRQVEKLRAKRLGKRKALVT